jgi:hypothetical protein
MKSGYGRSFGRLGALALACLCVTAGAADAKSCLEQVRSGRYSCSSFSKSGPGEPFVLQFDATGRTGLIEELIPVLCQCNSLGTEKTPNVEGSSTIVCTGQGPGNDPFLLSARATAKKLAAGTLGIVLPLEGFLPAFLECRRDPA